jgi:uncharacterized protein DUF4349
MRAADNRRRTRRTAAALLALPLVLFVAGCAGGNDSGGGSASAPDSSGGRLARDLASPSTPGEDTKAPASKETSAARIPNVPLTRAIVRTASLEVSTKDVQEALDGAEDIVRVAGGTVADEETDVSSDRPGRSSAQITLRVPPAQFNHVLDQLAKLGTLQHREQSASDVTGDVVDVRSRLSTQRRSVQRMRELLDRARTIADVSAVEGELTRREADLESLEAREALLADQTAMATVQVAFNAPVAPHPVDGKEKAGFLVGLQGGWDALVGAAQVTLTIVGALLPFLLLVAVLWLPARRLMRAAARRSRQRPADA